MEKKYQAARRHFQYFQGTFAAKILLFLTALSVLWMFAASPVYAGDYAEGEALVVLRNRVGTLSAASLSGAAGKNYIAGVAASAGAKAVATYSELSAADGGIFVLMRSEVKSTEMLIAQLRKLPDVECASPNYRIHAFATPNDPRYGELWGMTKIRAHEAWDTTTGSDNVYVAVMDTGIDRSHPDLAANLDTTLSRSFVNPGGGPDPVENGNYNDGNGHGSHVAGTIAAVGNNGTGVAGVNWKTKIIALKILADDGVGYTSWQIGALNYLVGLLKSRPDMKLASVNFSLGGWHDETPSEALTQSDWRAYRALDQLNRTVIAVAAGNEGSQVGAPATRRTMDYNTGDYCYPASYTGLDNMIVVGAIDRNNAGPSFTNWSSKAVHLVAPGAAILSTVPPSSYKFLQGTSMATPHVAGAAALVASANPNLTANALKDILCRSANSSVNPKAPARAGFILPYPVPPQGVPDTTVSRYGLLDVKAAVDMALSDAVIVPVTGISVTPNPLDLRVGESVRLSAEVTPLNATNRNVSWESAQPNIAAVDSTTGEVTGAAAGTAVITARALENTGVTAAVSVTVSEGSANPEIHILTQPSSQTVPAGNSAVFKVTAQGSGLSYRWQMYLNGDWYNAPEYYSGVYTDTLTLVNVRPIDSGDRFRCVVSNSAGSVLSEPAILTVTSTSTLRVITQPGSQTVAAGNRAVFKVAAQGSDDLTYRWQIYWDEDGDWYNTNPKYYSGVESSTMTLVNARADDNGDRFRCIVSDATTSVASGTATLTVTSSGSGPSPIETIGGGGCNAGLAGLGVMCALLAAAALKRKENVRKGS